MDRKNLRPRRLYIFKRSTKLSTSIPALKQYTGSSLMISSAWFLVTPASCKILLSLTNQAYSTTSNPFLRKFTARVRSKRWFSSLRANCLVIAWTLPTPIPKDFAISSMDRPVSLRSKTCSMI